MDNFPSLFFWRRVFIDSEVSVIVWHAVFRYFFPAHLPQNQARVLNRPGCKQSCLNYQTTKFVNEKKTKRDIKEAERECFTFFPFLYMVVNKNASKLSHVILYHEGWTEMLWKFILHPSQVPSALALGGLQEDSSTHLLHFAASCGKLWWFLQS